MKTFQVINSTGKMITEIKADGFKTEPTGVMNFFNADKTWVASVPGTILMVREFSYE